MTFYLVEMVNGPAWDPVRGRREQAGFAEHGEFLDALVDAGVVVLGGPVGEGEGDHALLVVRAADEAQVQAHLAPDPWLGSVLAIGSIRRWRLWLGSLPDA